MKYLFVILALLISPAYAQTSSSPAPVKNFTVILTEEDINLLLQFADICTKTQGLPCAEAAAKEAAKLRAVLAPPVEPKKP